MEKSLKLAKEKEDNVIESFNAVRTETVISKLPIHHLTKKGSVKILIDDKDQAIKGVTYWKVSPSRDYGEPRQLAYKLDTLVVNRTIDELGRPLPRLIKLGSLREVAEMLGVSTHNTRQIEQAFLQNASVFITANITYKGSDGTVYRIKEGFTRYAVFFAGKELPNGTKADAVYLSFNDPYWGVLNNAPVRPLDYDYLKGLTPGAQRFYEIISYGVYAAIRYRLPHCKLLYSEYCTYSAQQRYFDYDHFKKQMYKVHKPHLVSGYLESVSYSPCTDRHGKPDWVMRYVPGARARAEYDAFHTKGGLARKAFEAKKGGGVAADVTYLVEEILGVTGDKHSEFYYTKVARELPEDSVWMLISQTRQALAQGEIRTTAAQYFTDLAERALAKARQDKDQIKLFPS